MRYPALIDGEKGAYGVVFPDLDGIVAMGSTIDEALVNAEDSLQDYAIEAERDGLPLVAPSALEDIEVPAGGCLVSVLLVRAPRERPGARLNLVLDADVVDVITSESKRRGMSRKTYMERLVRFAAPRLGS